MNKKILIVSLVVFLGLGVAIYQYVKEVQSDFVNAYTASKPANGHSWSEMECTTGLCVTAGNSVGIGTDSPSKKLSVIGDISASGDICNGTGNCLSALATLTNACGGAATTYAYTATAYTGTYCIMGVSTPTTPAFPAAGSSTTWTCPVTSGSPISCTATHTAAPVNGVCGGAATTYAYTATAYSGALCSTGVASPLSPGFPSCGSSSSWSCLGTNGGASPSCVAFRNACPAALYGGVHNVNDCNGIAGNALIVSDGARVCQYTGASCPSGWNPYLNWTTTIINPGYTTGGCSSGPIQTVYTASCHAWGNIAVESLSSSTTVCNSTGYWTAYSIVTQIGCY